MALSVGITKRKKNQKLHATGRNCHKKTGSALHVSQRQSDILDLESRVYDVLDHHGKHYDHGCRDEHEAQIRQGEVDSTTPLAQPRIHESCASTLGTA